MKIRNYILNEASYHGNIGFTELVEFYQKANKKQIDELEEIIKREDWSSFKKYIEKVLGVKLK